MSTNFRGAQTAPSVSSQDVVELLKLKPNVIRYQILGDFLAECLQALDIVLDTTSPWSLVLCMMRTQEPSGDPRYNPVTDPATYVKLIRMWETIIDKYDDDERILAYDPLNEPKGTASQVNSFNNAIRAQLRQSTAKKICISSPYGDPIKFKNLKKLPDGKLWYEAHMYLPMKFTHQGIAGRPTGVKWLNTEANKLYIKDRLRHARNFQRQHSARIYIGEFGVSKYADEQSRINYLTQCIEVFEEYGWNYSYHAWREADVWNLEPDVINVMKKAWEKN